MQAEIWAEHQAVMINKFLYKGILFHISIILGNEIVKNIFVYRGKEEKNNNTSTNDFLTDPNKREAHHSPI